MPEDHLLADPTPPSFPPAFSAEQRAIALALFEETDEEVILASGVAPSTDDNMDERRHGGTRPSRDANANAAPPPVVNEAAGQVGGATSVRNHDPRRPCRCWEAASVPNWAAAPKVDDLDGLVGSASDGYVVLEAALPLSAVVPLLAMTRRQKNLKMSLLFNGYPLDRCNTHPGGRRMEDARLIFLYKPPRLPWTELLDEVGAWRAVGELGAVLAERLTVASGILFPAPGDNTHLRTTGRCVVQPAHTDAWEPWLQPANIPSASLIVALEDNTRVTVFPGSHRVFRW